MSKKPSTGRLVQPDEIESLLRVVRGQRVMLDFDLARLYGVTTIRRNGQVARNRQPFPEDFAYQLMTRKADPSIQPSLRDYGSFFVTHLPSSKLLGYSQSSLRDGQITEQKRDIRSAVGI